MKTKKEYVSLVEEFEQQAKWVAKTLLQVQKGNIELNQLMIEQSRLNDIKSKLINFFDRQIQT